MPNPQKLPPETVARMIELQARGWPYRKIAEELHVHINSVHRYLNKHSKRVLERLVAKSEAEKGRQIAVLIHTAAEALSAWEASRKPAVSVKKTTGGDSGDKIEKTVRGQSGNPSLLAEARGAMSDIRKILHLDEADGDEQSAVALATLAAALESALAKLPPDLQPIARQHLSGALQELTSGGHTD